MKSREVERLRREHREQLRAEKHFQVGDSKRLMK